VITIQITNAHDVVRAKKGWFVANVVGAVVDMDAQVESVVARRAGPITSPAR